MYKNNNKFQSSQKSNSFNSLKNSFEKKQINARAEEDDAKKTPSPSPTAPTAPPAIPSDGIFKGPINDGTKNTAPRGGGYGDALNAAPGKSYFTMEIRDSDGDGIDDRYQTGAGEKRQSVGSLSEEYQDYIRAGRPPIENWNWDEYKKKKNIGISPDVDSAAPSLLKRQTPQSPSLMPNSFKSKVY